MHSDSYKVDHSAYLSVMWIFLGALTTYIMYYYPNHKIFPYHVYLPVWLAYFCSIGIALLVPLDLATTIEGREHPNYYNDNIGVVIVMYFVFYTIELCLNNVVLVFQEMYNASGYFKPLDKMKGIFVDLCWQILGGIVFGAIFFGILVGKHIVGANMNAVLLTIVIMTNTIWLTYLMILLGYGFIIFPIRMWETGSLSKELDRIQHKASSLYEDMRDDSSDISLCVAHVLKTNDHLSRTKEFSAEIEELMILIPEGFSAKGAGEVAIDPKENKVTLNSLAKLKHNLYEKKQNYMITKRKVEELEKEAWMLEDIINTIDNSSEEIVWTIEPKYKINKFLEHYYYTKVRHIFYKILAILSFVTSLFSFLGVFGSIKSIPLETSVYFVVLHDNEASGTGIVIFTLLTLGYACYVAMWALYEMKITGVMELVGGQGSWPISMSFHARMVARLIPPLVFFYLGWVHENQDIGGNFEKNIDGVPIYTAFSKFYQIQVVPVLGNSFSTLFPILLLCVSFLTATNILNRILVWLKLEKYQFGKTFISESALIDGKKRLADKKKLALSGQRRQNFSKEVKKSQTVKKITKNPMIGYNGLELDDIDL